MNALKRTVLTLALAGGLSGAGVGLFASAAGAAPIYCPNGQTATKTSSGWVCENSSGHGTGAGWHNGTGNKI